MKEEEYEKIISGLIDILSYRYDIFEKLAKWELKEKYPYQGFIKAKQKLQILSEKEKRLLNQIPKNLYTLLVMTELSFSLPETNRLKSQIINDRLNRIISKIIDQIPLLSGDEDLEEYEENLEEYEEKFLQSSNKTECETDIEVEIEFNLLEKLQKIINSARKKENLIGYKYAIIFQNPDLDSALELIDYNLKDMIKIDDALKAKLLNQTEEDYLKLKQKVIFEKILEKISLFSNDINEEISPEKYSEILVIELFSIIELIKLLETENLLRLKELINSIEDELIEDALKEINKTIDETLKKSTNNPSIFNKQNEECYPIDEETAKSLINIIKLEEKIFEIMEELAAAKNKKPLFQQLNSLTKLEQELLQKIKITPETEEEIYSIINDCIPLLLNNGGEIVIQEDLQNPFTNQNIKELSIKRRLISAIPCLYKRNKSSSILTTKSVKQINRAHLLRSLKEYQTFISESEENTVESQKIYLREYFIEYPLTQHLLMTEGHSEDLIIPSNALSAKLANISEIEYAFDKDEQLFEKGKSIIEIINDIRKLDLPPKETKAYLKFLTIRIKDIKRNISDEHNLALAEYAEETLKTLILKPTKTPKRNC